MCSNNFLFFLFVFSKGAFNIVLKNIINYAVNLVLRFLI